MNRLIHFLNGNCLNNSIHKVKVPPKLMQQIVFVQYAEMTFVMNSLNPIKQLNCTDLNIN